MSGKIDPADIKHDDPTVKDDDLDFGDALGDGEEEGTEGEEDADGNAAGEADGEADGEAGEEEGKDGKDGEEADPDERAGDGEADGEDGEEDSREKGLSARRDGTKLVPSFRLRQKTVELEQAEQRVRELEQKLLELSGSKKSPDPVETASAELETLYEQVEEARAEGRVKDAAKLQQQIDSKNREITEIRATRTSTKQALVVAQQQAYDSAVAEIETKFPELNPDSEVYDPALAQEVLDLRDGFVATKKASSAKDALQRAIRYVFNDEYLETGTAHLYKKETKSAAKEAGKEKDEGKDKGKEKGAERKGTAVKKNLDANRRQPPVLGDAGRADSKGDKVDVAKISDADWDALPESTKARLRGDFVGA